MRNRRSLQASTIFPLALCTLVFCFWAAGCTSPANTYVDAAATGRQNGSEEFPFRSISMGLGFVTNGGTVHVAPGDYAENLVIRQPVKLLGAGIGETILLADITRKGIEIQSGDVEVAGFSIVGQGEPDPDNYFIGGIWAEEVDNITLRDNEVGPYWMMGIGAGKAANIRIENNRVSQISGADYGESYGYIVALSHDILMKDNLAFDIEEGFGFYVSESQGLLQGNTSTGNAGGMFVRTNPDDDPDLRLMSNHIYENLELGLALHRAIISAFFDNTILNNVGAGVVSYDHYSFLACELAGGSSACEHLLVTEILDCGNNTIEGNSPDFEYPMEVQGCFGGDG